MKSLHRITLLAAALTAYGQTSEAPKIVFVCEHGAAKSIMAAAEFERMAKARGLSFRIVARGTNPDAEVAASVRQGLKADGMDVGAAKPVKVSTKDLEGAARVITFGPDLSEWLPKTQHPLDWSAAPAPGKDYTAARDYMRRRMETLLAELDKK